MIEAGEGYSLLLRYGGIARNLIIGFGAVLQKDSSVRNTGQFVILMKGRNERREPDCGFVGIISCTLNRNEVLPCLEVINDCRLILDEVVGRFKVDEEWEGNGSVEHVLS